MNIAIIGSNRGIGLELVKQYQKEGLNVFAFCRKSSEKLQEASPFKIIENFDVTNEENLKDKLTKEAQTTFDIVIHVSGILIEDKEDDFQKGLVDQFVVNAIGPIHSYNAFSSFLGEQSKFAVLTSQLGSITNNVSGGRFGYRMSKAAANMACKNLAIEARKNNTTLFMLHPGYVETDMTDHNAEITPETSAKGLKKIIEDIVPSQAGSFWHVNGEELPW